MNQKTLITQSRVGKAYWEILALQMAARELGWNVEVAPTSWRLNEDYLNQIEDGVCYGSQIFCEVICQQTGWKLHQNSFGWLANLPKKFIKRQVSYMTMKEARLISHTAFIKPADDKRFDAKVYPAGEFYPSEEIADDCPVLISEPVNFTHEYRCFVDSSGVKSWSNYLYEGEVANPKLYHTIPSNAGNPIDFVNNLTKEVKFSPSVIDVGLIDGKGWAIVESNPAWASGLYGCDPTEALLVIEQTVER